MKVDGLSILIPIYNRDVTSLVASLVNQCEAIKINFEILCYDDDSLVDFKLANTVISNFNQVQYQLLPKNHGRSKIRNLLAKDATYPLLLFLDCDSQLTSPSYISNYLYMVNDLMHDSVVAIYGGTCYQNEKPAPDHLLHWHYGRRIEALNCKTRELSPYESFKTNNFVVLKSVFAKIQFDASIETYGYEDSLFAKDLEKEGLVIMHVANEVLHHGIESDEVFLHKLEQSITNLKKLSAKGRSLNTRLSKTADSIRKYRIYKVFKPFHVPMEKVCLCILKKRPSALFFLQFWKLLKYLY